MPRIPLVLCIAVAVAGCQQKVPDSGASYTPAAGAAGASDGSIGSQTLAALHATSGGGSVSGAASGAGSYETAPVGNGVDTSGDVISSSALAPAAAGAAPLAANPVSSAATTGGNTGANTGASSAGVAPAGAGNVAHGTGTTNKPMNAMSPATITPGAGTARTSTTAPQGTAVQFGSQTEAIVDLGAYARAVQNNPGEPLFPRGNVTPTGPAECSKYAGPDIAQSAFLKAGGPAKDPLNLDSDGDGFACGWDPAPFRN